MNKYQKKYVELKKSYQQTEGAAASVQALYEYKDWLEKQEEEAKASEEGEMAVGETPESGLETESAQA